MKKILPLIATALISANASFAQVTEGEYLLQNVDNGQYLAGGVIWGTCACTNGKPQWFGVAATEGGYTFDSHQYNDANSHYLGTDLYCDAIVATWEITPTGTEGVYTISNNGNYLAGNGTNAVVKTVTTASDATAQWRFISKDDIVALQAEATAEKPVDVTAFILDPQLKRNGNTTFYPTWTITGFDGTGTPDNFNQGQDKNFADCAESFHSSNGFKAAQTVTGLKAGVYAVSASGFYRNDGSGTDYPYIFANGSTSTLPARTGTENNMVAAYASFLKGNYKIDPIYVEVSEGGSIELGVAGSAEDIWNIFGEFTLNYYGTEAISTSITKAASSAGESIASTSKLIKQGKLVITKGDKQYDAAGALLK